MSGPLPQQRSCLPTQQKLCLQTQQMFCLQAQQVCHLQTEDALGQATSERQRQVQGGGKFKAATSPRRRKVQGGDKSKAAESPRRWKVQGGDESKAAWRQVEGRRQVQGGQSQALDAGTGIYKPLTCLAEDLHTYKPLTG